MKKQWITCLMIIAMFYIGDSLVEASNAPLFSVKPILTNKQNPDISSYFDLQVSPGSEEIMEVDITNSDKIEKIIDITVNTAQSNQNGVIDYTKSDEKLDESLTHPLTNLVEGPEEVTVAAGETKRLSFALKTPSIPFEGMILGGISFMERGEETEASSKLKNLYSYTIAVKLTQSDQKITANLNFLSGDVAQANKRNIIEVIMQNDQPIILSEMLISAKVYLEGHQDPVYSKIVSEYKMAPNSHLPFRIGTGSQAMEAGKYRIEMEVESGKDKWRWSTEFTVTKNQVKQLNESAVDLPVSSNQSGYWLIGAVLLAVLLVIGVRQKKKQVIVS